MCLGIPARVLEIWEESGMKYAEVDMGGVRKKVFLITSEEVNPGDYVIVHAGTAISKIDEEEVEETLKLWEEFLKSLA